MTIPLLLLLNSSKKQAFEQGDQEVF